jgi:mRNA interferase MazF
MNTKRGEIFLADLDPVKGKEIAKTRPVVVVSNDLNNRFSDTVTILPITSGKLERIFPFEVLLPKGKGNLTKDSKAKADQIRTLDKARLFKIIGRLDPGTIKALEEAIRIHLELPLR